MKIEVPPLQLAEWLIHGIAVIIALMQVDSVNDRTLWPIPRAQPLWERIRNIQGGARFFLAADAPMMPRRRRGARMTVIDNLASANGLSRASPNPVHMMTAVRTQSAIQWLSQSGPHRLQQSRL
ncbi:MULTISPECIES: hypothetical protein [unclassified Novosphingobium]|uniref:hypothetical protein n=1 Tax=unclassified Novosphingobium TaxID=2644732 RepID=UPI0025D2C298|nr:MULTISPECIES: hypothetical protein [unclassified Novosphingobium]